MDENKTDEWEALRSLRRLVKAGLDLGIPEAVRKAAQFAPLLGGRGRGDDGPEAASIPEMLQSIKNDPSSILHLAKEVWSRGGSKDKEGAAEAVGIGLGLLTPHRALQVAKELAAMARNGKEADLVGRKAIAPILSRSPVLLDRVKQLLTENQKLIRHAAITGLVFFVQRKRKSAAVALEVILLVAEEHEKEIRDAVRWAVAQVSQVDPKATAKAIADWVKANPTTERVQAAGLYAKKIATDVGRAVGRTVARFAPARARNGSRGAKPRARRSKSAPPKG